MDLVVTWQRFVVVRENISRQSCFSRRRKRKNHMSLRVIGFGVGRTGTFSMKLALEELGFGPCHHMEEVDARSPEQIAMWASAADGKVIWRKAYAGFHSAVDWPTAAFSRELAAAHPDAKCILTLRDPEKWYESFSQTIYPLIQPTEKTPPELLPFLQMVVAGLP
jgi:hypothetical protein